MYRVLIFVVILNIVDSIDEGKNYIEEDFFKLARRVISVERQFENYCRDNMDKRFKEIYGTDSYTLKYDMKKYIQEEFNQTMFGYRPEDVIIKVTHRAFYVDAKRQDPIGSQGFWALKMLPDNLDWEKASWTMKEQVLEVTFPYKAPLGVDVKKSCGNIKYRVITVPMTIPEQDGLTSNDTIVDKS